MAYERAFGDGGLGGISGVVSSLPAGFSMGEVRWQSGIKYRLLHNGGNSQAIPGQGLVAIGAGAGPYTCTISSVSGSITGVRGICHHATATTGTYFWGVTFGHPVKILASNTSLATDAQVGIGVNGAFHLTTTIGNMVARNIGDSTSATATTDAAGSRFLVVLEETKACG